MLKLTMYIKQYNATTTTITLALQRNLSVNSIQLPLHRWKVHTTPTLMG